MISNSTAIEKEPIGLRLSKIIDIRSYSMIIALVLISVFFNILTKGVFLDFRNISNLLRQMSIVTIVSTGIFFVILAGHIDLSVGSSLGMIGGFAAILLANYKVNAVVTVVILLVVGALIGLYQGILVAYLKVPAFIVTLGGYLIFRGILIGVTKGVSIQFVNESFSSISQSYLSKSLGFVLAIAVSILMVVLAVLDRRSRLKYKLKAPSWIETIIKLAGSIILIIGFTLALNSYEGIPTPVMIMLVLVVIFSIIANNTNYGRSMYAIGGNINAASYSGINVKKLTAISFAICGALSSVAGIVLVARLNAGTPSAGNMAELDAIAAAVIGGTSLSGGRGKVPGIIVGALIMASIDNGMSIMNMDSFWQYIVKGFILVYAVLIDGLTNKKS